MKKTEFVALLEQGILEGIHDNLTTQLSRLIVNHLKSWSMNPTIPDFTGKVGDLQVLAHFRRGGTDKTRITSGRWSPLSKTIKVDIQVPTVFKLADLDWFIPKLKDTLRHELEHYQQDVRGGGDLENPKMHSIPSTASTAAYPQKGLSTSSEEEEPSIDKIRAYYLHPSEIEAFVMGAYKEAKTRKVPFQDVLSEKLTKIYYYVQKSFDRPWATQITKEIRAAWTEYAKKRLPSISGLGSLP